MNGKKAKHLRQLFQNYLKNKGREAGIISPEKLEMDKGSFRRFKQAIQALPHPEQLKIGI